MPAYAKIKLVTPLFHPSDIAFALGWSRFAPGLGGWQVMVDQQPDTTQVAIVPPGAEDPVFVLQRAGAEVEMQRLRPEGRGEPVELGRFPTLREALLHLCPISDAALEEIHIELEAEFPRAGRD